MPGQRLAEAFAERFGLQTTATTSQALADLNKMLKELMATAQFETMAETVRAMHDAVQQKRAQAAVPPVPTWTPKDMGFDLSALMQTISRFSEQLQTALHQEREAHLETKAKLIEASANERKADRQHELSLADFLYRLMEKDRERDSTLLAEMVKNELREIRQQIGGGRIDPITEKLLTPVAAVLSEAIQRTLKPAEPSAPANPAQVARETLREMAALMNDYRNLFAPPSSENNERWAFAREKLAAEERKANREMELKREIEQERANTLKFAVERIDSILDKAVQLIRGPSAPAQVNGATPVAATAPSGPPTFTCPNCGHEFLHPGRSTFSCPRCHWQFGTAAPEATTAAPARPSPVSELDFHREGEI